MRQGGRDSAATNANNLLLNEIQKPTHTHTLTHTHCRFPKEEQVPPNTSTGFWGNNYQFTTDLCKHQFYDKALFLSPPPLSSSADTSQLAQVILTSASISSGPSSPPAPWVETCSCPPGFAGQFCERCAAGFTRDDPGRGPLSACVPCNCHQHGSCHPDTGNKRNSYGAFGVRAEFQWWICENDQKGMIGFLFQWLLHL